MTNPTLCDNSRRETSGHLCEPGGQRTHTDEPERHPAHPAVCHNHLDAVVRFEPTERRCPESCAHCHAAESAAAALGSRTGAAPNARRWSPRPHLRLLLLWTLYSRASPTSALLPKMSSHTAGSQFGTTRASALLKRRWTHLGQPTCDSCSKVLSRQAPPPHAHGHSRRHTHPSAGALGVC